MSTSFISNSAIGLKVFWEQIFTEVKVKAFEHDYPEDLSFHPETQKRLWDYKILEKDGFDTGRSLFCKKYTLLPITDYRDDSQENYIIALKYAVSDDQRSMKMSMRTDLDFQTLTNEFEEFKTLAIEKNVWDPNYFGLWTFLNFY